ncbi:MAG: EAL domain-containing protein [Alteromonadaceae bacterium]|nr:EAL domain-containing protein [Alteromonadaceae bacterium]
MTNIIKLDSHRVSFAHQPIVRMRDNKVVAHELLLREFNQLKMQDFCQEPALFVEHMSFLVRGLAKQIREMVIEGKLRTVFVNFSPEQICHPQFPEALESFYEQGLHPSSVVIEVTENDLPKDVSGFYHNVKHARNNGHPIVCDDFGAGISNFRHVMKMKPGIIKTDMTLVREAAESVDDEKSLRALVNCFHDIGVKVVVEGIETAEHLSLAQRVGGDFGQGYYFGRPEARVDNFVFEPIANAQAPVRNLESLLKLTGVG